MTFIRAPYIEKISEAEGIEILSEVEGKIVAARQRNMLAMAFHPELTNDVSIHRYFLELCK
jgi:5'-phosphate synthase pdxT subunit